MDKESGGGQNATPHHATKCISAMLVRPGAAEDSFLEFLERRLISLRRVFLPTMYKHIFCALYVVIEAVFQCSDPIKGSHHH